MNLARWARLVNTVRHLRSRQIFFRLYYRIWRHALLRKACALPDAVVRRQWKQPWKAPLVSARMHWGGGRFEVLGENGQVNVAVDWNNAAKSKLWLYNLHYLDDLNAADSAVRRAEQAALIERWIRDNPRHLQALAGSPIRCPCGW